MSYVLWGFHSSHGNAPLKLSGGSVRELRPRQRDRERDGWTCAIYKAGDAPEGLAVQAKGAAARAD